MQTIKKLLKFFKNFAIFLVVFGVLFSNIPFNAITSLLNSYQKSNNIVDQAWHLSQKDNVVDNFISNYRNKNIAFLDKMAGNLKIKEAQAAASYVGGVTCSRAGSTATTLVCSLTALTGGSNASPSQNDIVIAVVSTGSTADRAIGVTNVGYTELPELYANGTTNDTNLSVSWKIMGATPDSSVTFSASGSTADAISAVVHVWRGIDTGTPFDVTNQSATGTGTGRPNPPPITPVTSGATIIAIGASAAGTGAVYTAAGLSNFRTVTSVDTYDSMTGMGSYAWAGGAYDPAQWTGGTTNAADSWASYTLALRPSLPVVTISDFVSAEPGNSTIAPGASGMVDSFGFATNAGTDTVTAATVGIAAGMGQYIQTVAITNDGDTVTYCSAAPSGDTASLSTCGIPVSTTNTQFKIKLTAKAHTSMPAPAGGLYNVTATITGFTSTNGQSGTDSGSSTLTIDNASPGGTTGAGATSGENGQSTVSWTNPGDGDFQQVYIYCKTGSMISGEAPTEGTDPAVDATACDATARMKYKGTASPQVITGLSNGTTYYFRIYARDTNGNFTAYSATQEVTGTPSVPAANLTISASTGSKIVNVDSGATSAFVHDTGCTTDVTCAAFKLAASGGAVSVTSITVTETNASLNADTDLANAALIYDTDANYSNGTAGTFGTDAAFTSQAVTFTNAGLNIPNGSTYYFYIRTDFANGTARPDGGLTVNFQIALASDVVSDGTESGSATLAGTTTIRPNISSYSNSTEPALTDGARETQTISISGAGFGTTCSASNKVSIGAYDLSCTGATFTDTNITISVDAGLPNTNDGGTGANGLLVTIGNTADDARQTFYVYPDVTSIMVPTAVTDAAREYLASDSDGIITVNGNHFGAAGTVTILGSTGTQQTTATCTGTAYQATCVGLQVPTAIANNSYTGNVVLTRTVDSKTDTYAGFRVLPRIASTSPVNLKGGRGDTVSITGDHLCQSGSCPTAFSATDKVSFNGGEVTSGSSTWTDTSIPSIVIPGTAIDGNLNITSNTSYTSNNLTYNIKFAPTTPTNSTPTNGATGESKNPTLTSSNFDDGTDGDIHSDSQWQITKLSGDYTAGNKVWEDTLATAQVTIVVNSTNGTFTNTTLSTELNCNTTYWWRARYKDNAGVTSQEWSAYSGEFSFTTASCGPDATSMTNNDEPAIADGGRIGHTNIVISGSGFGTVNAGSRANCAGGAGTGCVKVGGTGGQTIADARVTAWANTSITIQLSLTDLTTAYGGATTSGLIIYAAGVSDGNGLTFYIYPDVTSLTTPLGSNDGAREYSASDTDGIITITGNKFGTGPTGGSVVIVGGTVATYVADGTCDAVDGWAETCIKVQVPTTISDSTDSGYAIVTQGTGSGNKATNSTDTQSAINIWPRVTGIAGATFSDGGYQNGTFTLNGNHFGATSGSISVNGQTQDGTPTWGAASITGVGIPNTGTDSGNIILTKSDTKTSNTFSTFYIYPQITGFTNETDGALADGGRQAHVVTISGNHFGTGGGNAQIVINGIAPSTSTPTWGATSITGVDIPNTGTDSGVMVVTNPQTSKPSNNSSTFYIYPTITSLTVPTATTDAAREYLASDSDGIITVNGNHFGVAGTVTILGSTGTQQTTATCTGTAYQTTCVGLQVPTAIADNSYTGNVALNRTADSKTHTYAGFRVLPRVTSFNPNSGATNDPIVVIGNHLCQSGTCPTAGNRSTASDNVTFFNAVQVTDGNVTAWGHGDSSTSGVNVNVPSAAATGNVVVTSNTYVSNGVSFTKLSSAPADPTNLLQFKTSNDLTDSPPTHDPLTGANPDGKISTGGGINQTNTWLRATAQAGISATLCIQVEVKTVAAAFDGTGTVDGTGPDGCKSFTVGTPVKLFVNVPSLTDGNSYKWRSRIQNQSTLEYSNWVNAAVDGQSKSFYIDTTAPSSLNATCPPSTYTASTADISWTPVDNVSTTFTKQVQYGIDSSFASSTCTPGSTCGTPTSGLGANPQTTQLTGLTPSAVYYYRVRSKDAAGNEKVEGYGLSGNTTCTFTTSKAEMRTAEYIITGETGALSAETLRNFQIYITEQGANIQNAFIEISGIASANASNLTLGLKAVGSQDPGYTNYTVATSATVSTPFTVLHRIDPTASGIYIAPTQTTNNVLYVNPTGGPSVYIASAKIIVTYYYTP